MLSRQSHISKFSGDLLAEALYRYTLWRFQQKLKRLTATLSHWSKLEFGDIYANVKNYEEKVKEAEEKLILNNKMGINRSFTGCMLNTLDISRLRMLY